MTISYDTVESRMVGKPDGWYVFDAQGYPQNNAPYETEEDADDDKLPGQWVGQLDEGTIDFSYSPDNFGGI